MAIVFKYDYAVRIAGCNFSDEQKTCSVTEAMTNLDFIRLAVIYSGCSKSETSSTGTIDCRGGCKTQSKQCTNGSLGVQCVLPKGAAMAGCGWYPP